jgi:hypothetical protein
VITSAKAKAIVCAIITVALGVLGTVGSSLQAGEWNGQSTVALITAILVALGSTLGVYTQANAPG